MEKKNTLWTRDFTVLTLGSVVSMFGNAMSGFAVSLMVLDYSESTLLYALFIIAYTLPQIIMPIFSGALLDRFSRRKTIYTLDFVSAFLYAAVGLLLHNGWYNFPGFACFAFLVGSINSPVAKLVYLLYAIAKKNEEVVVTVLPARCFTVRGYTWSMKSYSLSATSEKFVHFAS